ncbi:hypothetical protein TWF281_000978 [Arthrobotrys megalospora]
MAGSKTISSTMRLAQTGATQEPINGGVSAPGVSPRNRCTQPAPGSNPPWCNGTVDNAGVCQKCGHTYADW